MLCVDKSRESKSAEVAKVWEIYDDRLSFMSARDGALQDALGVRDVCAVWDTWSSAAEGVFVTFCAAGGPVLWRARGDTNRPDKLDACDAAFMDLYRCLSAVLLWLICKEGSTCVRNFGYSAGGVFFLVLALKSGCPMGSYGQGWSCGACHAG